MIWLDDNGTIVIKTDITKNNVYELMRMKNSVLALLETQEAEFADKDENYWAFQLVRLLEPNDDQICLK